MTCSRCNDPDGWVTTPTGLAPCPWCRQDTHQRWASGGYDPDAADQPRGDTDGGKRPPPTMSPPVDDDPMAVQAEFAARYGQVRR